MRPPAAPAGSRCRRPSRASAALRRSGGARAWGVAALMALVAASGCSRDVPVGEPAAAGGLPEGHLTDTTGGADDRPPADTFTGSWRTAELGLSGLGGFRIVTGDLVVDGPAIDSWANFELEQVGGDLVVCGAEALEVLNLGALTTVGGELRLCDAPALRSVTLPALQAVGGALLLERLGGLRVLNVAALEASGGVLTHDVGLTTLSLDALTTVEGDVSLAPRLTSAVSAVQAPALASVRGSLEVIAHPSLRTVSLPALTEVGGAVIVIDNPLLRELDLSALEAVGGGGCICDNPALPACVAEAAAGAAGDAASISLRNNTGSGTCDD